MKNQPLGEDKVVEALDALRTLVEDFFILQATLAGVGQREITKMLRINRSRVSRIAKYGKKDKA
jgi:predicted XRE-type DNA-binding protein